MQKTVAFSGAYGKIRLHGTYRLLAPKREVTGMKRALLCTLLAALLLCACTRAPESTVRAPDAGEPLTLCLGAGL